MIHFCVPLQQFCVKVGLQHLDAQRYNPFAKTAERKKKTIGDMEKNYVKPEMEFVPFVVKDRLCYEQPIEGATEMSNVTFDAKERDESEMDGVEYEQTNDLW